MLHKGCCVALLLTLLGAWLLLPCTPASAEPLGPPTVTPTASGVQVEWHMPPAAPQQLGLTGQELVTIGGVRLPAQLIALRIMGDQPIAARIERLASAPWNGEILAAEPIIPRTIDGAERPARAAHPDRTLPETPIVVLREGRIRGARIAVLALSRIFAQHGAAHSVTALRATVPDAAVLAEDAATLLATDGPFLASAPGPGNPAVGTGWRVRVTRAGIQRLTAATLAAAGVPLSNPATIHLYYNGAEVPLEQRGSSASLELRFYAPAPGDRWNAADTYWLRAEATPRAPMARRAVMPATARLRADAIERGVWRHNTLYDTVMPGPDGDHWYAADLKTGPGQPAAALSIPLTATLPLAVGTTVLTLTGSAYTTGQHTLSVTLGASTHRATWSNAGDWSQSFTFAAGSSSAVVKLLPGSAPDGVELDSVAWTRAVRLNAGGRGVAFDGVAGRWRYQLTSTAPGRALYDISTPHAPSALTIPAGADLIFEDGPAAHRYVVTGPGTLWTPAISRSMAFDFATPGRAIAIAPAGLHPALAPLVARRQAQGYSMRVIDVQAIYDAWSFGQVAPDAIRAFLRYAAARWRQAPQAVTLVGDATSDPLNYTGHNNANIIPPYLAMVDPWMGETACEVCYARLDGDDPTRDPLPDLTIGRLPVKSAAELAALVAKIIAYETSPLDVAWRSRNLYIADDADAGGDFAAFSDASARQQPEGVAIERMYYDPRSPGGSWREPSAVRAYRRTIAALNAGVGLANFVGHGSPYQWATTDPAQSPPYLLGLYDVDDLTNGPRQPIMLEMTCLTGAFHTPAFSGTTIDERFVLKPDGGAIAVWAPTGQAVAYGHDWLQRGFYRALWAVRPLSARLGQLTAAGYLDLFTSGSCCQEALATYALLGDPLLVARVLPARRVYLPAVRR